MRTRAESAGRLSRPLLITLLACAGSAVGFAGARAESPARPSPQPAPDPDARIWDQLNQAARRSPAKRGARSIVVAEAGYPRSAAEAETLAGQAFVLVTALADSCGQALVERVTLHVEDGQEADLVPVAAQTNDLEGKKHPAVRLVGSCRHDALFHIPLEVTATKAYVTATVAGRTQVVLRFPRTASAYPRPLPVLPPGVPERMGEAGAIARALYPFFRVPPIRAPEAEPTCPLHGPPVPSAPPPSPAAAADVKARLAPASETGAGTATVRGNLDKEIIRRSIGPHAPEVRACYERELWTNPKLSARVMVQFIIAGDGWVTGSVLQQSTVDNKRLTDCIVAVVRCWRFPKPINGGIVIVSYPFVLTPAPDDD